MDVSRVNLNKLMAQAQELRDLINVTNEVLDEPVSQLTEEFNANVSRFAPYMAVQFQKMVNRGRLDYVLVGGALVGAGWVGAKVIDAVRNTATQEKTKAKLAGYYQELASKQSSIIAMQQQINREIATAVNDLQADSESYRQKLAELNRKQEQLTDLLSRFAALQASVEK